MQGKDFVIDACGFFKSRRTAPTTIVEVTDNYIDNSGNGDTLLSMYCTIGVIYVTFGDEIVYSGASSYDFFDGLPMHGQYNSRVWVRKSDERAQVFAVFEKYGASDRNELAVYSAPYNQERGVKLAGFDKNYQVIRRGGEGVPTIVQIL